MMNFKNIGTKFKTGFDNFKSDQRGVILLTLTMVSVVAVIISALIVQATLDQVQTSYRNIRSSSAFGASQTGIEDALKELSRQEALLAANPNDPDVIAAYLNFLNSIKGTPQNCLNEYKVGNQECKWTLTQDSVVGTIKKDYAVTFDLKPEPNALPQASTGNKFIAWDCSTPSAMVITFISRVGVASERNFIIEPVGGKLAIKCPDAGPNIQYDVSELKNVATGCAIGSGEARVKTGYKQISIPGDTKYLRIRAVGADVKNLNILSANPGLVNCSASWLRLNYWKDAVGKDFPLRDVITSEGIDGVSRISRIARSKDLQVPALLDFVLYTDGDISK